jgi:hypothetical protein
MLQVARGNTVGDTSPAEISALRSHFDRHHWIRLPDMVEAHLLRDIQDRLARAQFVERVHHGVTPPSVDLCMIPNAAAALMELAFNDPAILRVVEQITGCASIARFGGFVYRLAPGVGHQHHWHNDLVESRQVAMSVNLGPGTYEGGLLELRDRASEEILARLPNTGPGDALLFRLDQALQHRATPVTSGVKTAFAGWYFADESYTARLRALAETTMSDSPARERRGAQGPPQATEPGCGAEPHVK